MAEIEALPGEMAGCCGVAGGPVHRPPKAEVTGSNPVGCASPCCFACIETCSDRVRLEGECVAYVCVIGVAFHCDDWLFVRLRDRRQLVEPSNHALKGCSHLLPAKACAPVEALVFRPEA